MATEILGLAFKLYGFIQEQNELADEIDFMFNKLKISLTGVIEGL